MTEIRRRIKRSQQQERRGAALHGGRPRPASGALPTAKGDVRADEHLIEYKRTDGKQLTIKLDHLEKIRREALIEGRTQLLGFELGGRDYLVVEAGDWQALQEELRGFRARGAGRVDRR